MERDRDAVCSKLTRVAKATGSWLTAWILAKLKSSVLTTRAKTVQVWSKLEARIPILTYVRKMNRWWTVVLTLGTGAAVVLDFASRLWVNHSMLTGLISGALVLGWTVLLVNGYVSAREQRRWLVVAVTALEDLGRVTRATWVELTVNLKLTIVLEPRSAPDLRDLMLSSDGRSGLRQATGKLATSPAGRDLAFEQLHRIAEKTREILALWTPIMVTQPGSAKLLADFADLHRRIVRLLGILHVERASGVPASEPDVADRLASIILAAGEQDLALFEAAEALASKP